MKKPIIGVTCPWSVETWGDSIESGGFYYAGKPYAEALSKYGGVPLLIPPEYNAESLNDTLDSILNVVDGLLFTGGGNVKRKSDEGLPTLRGQQPTRYDFEAALLKRAYEKKVAVLGICRGFQMIVEVFGGSLSDDITKNHKQDIPFGDPWHEVQIDKNSKLYEIIGDEVWNVNSIHVQKVDKTPENFIVSARAKDGVVEGVESINHPFFIGFQFHPEFLLQNDKTAGEIFKYFINTSE